MAKVVGQIVAQIDILSIIENFDVFKNYLSLNISVEVAKLYFMMEKLPK